MKDYEELFVALRRITRAIDLHSKSCSEKQASPPHNCWSLRQQ